MRLQEYLYGLATDKISGGVAGILKGILLFLSLIYGLAVCFLIFWNNLRKKKLPCKVISVGNITLGGTGKTMMVELIAGYLKSRGHKPAILSRGYKKPRAYSVKLLPGYEAMGDEPFMMWEKFQNVPVLVDPDRIRSAKAAVAGHAADTVILDDGFQQWRVKKDLEIVMLDGVNPFGNRRLLPRGILRQPMFTLKGADVFVLINSGAADLGPLKKNLSIVNSHALILEAERSAKGVFRLSRKKEILPFDFLKGRDAALFCGLGNPESFRESARKIGVKEGMFFEFPDHYRYDEEDLEKMVKESGKKNISILVTTEKDAVRIPLAARKRFGENIFVLAVELKFKDEEQRFFDRLLRVYPA
ncbi:MAG: tetraacyldisaccharide 4'-kinase [Candidatus Omnitrophota bacterium]